MNDSTTRIIIETCAWTLLGLAFAQIGIGVETGTGLNLGWAFGLLLGVIVHFAEKRSGTIPFAAVVAGIFLSCGYGYGTAWWIHVAVAVVVAVAVWSVLRWLGSTTGGLSK